MSGRAPSTTRKSATWLWRLHQIGDSTPKEQPNSSVQGRRTDVKWRKDSSQIRRGKAPRVMASLRIAITILRLEGEDNLAKATRDARNDSHRALTSS